MAPAPDLEQRISGIAALDQPLRRDLYRLLAERDDWVGRDEASEALGVPRSVAAFHLDKLVEAGVLEVTFRRTTGRTGPGAGRPAKLYRPAADEVSASVPDRRYDLAGSLLASAVAESDRTGEPIADCVTATARAAGRSIAARGTDAGAGPGAEPAAEVSSDDERRAVLDFLARHGYEPTVGDDGEIALGNCPFHRLVEDHRELVCGMNRDFLTGVIDGIDVDDGFEAHLAPEPGYCCVRIRPR